MAYMLDTNIVSYVLKAKASPKLKRYLDQCQQNNQDIYISSITYAEILHGIRKVGNPQRLVDALNFFLKMCKVLDWDERCAIAYATLRTELNKNGITVQSMDLMIGAHAQAYNLTLITNDHIFDYFKAHSLTVENWYN